MIPSLLENFLPPSVPGLVKTAAPYVVRWALASVVSGFILSTLISMSCAENSNPTGLFWIAKKLEGRKEKGGHCNAASVNVISRVMNGSLILTTTLALVILKGVAFLTGLNMLSSSFKEAVFQIIPVALGTWAFASIKRVLT